MLQDIAQLRRRIEDADGLLTVRMATLRNACGAQRLGTQIKAKIASALTEAGIASLPAQLPDHGDAEVRLLLVDGPIHATWRALSAPSAEGDQTLRQLTLGAENTRALAEVRHIVGDLRLL